MEKKKVRWLIGAIVLAALGCAVSVYSTLHHVEVKNLGFSDAACNINETFSCDDVAKSQYSEVFGVPLGVYGFGYFLGLLVLAGMTLYKRDEEFTEGPVAYKVLAATGVIVSIVLGGLSWFSVGVLCISCIAVYSICFIQAVWMAIHVNDLPSGFDAKPLLNGGITALIALLISITVYNFTLGAGTGKDGEVDPVKATEAQKAYEIEINYSAYSGFGEDYRKGDDNAQVQIVEFADFECPACSATAKVLKKVAEEYGNRVLIVFKNYPLDQKCNDNIRSAFHKWACDAAIMARCAGMHGKFWEFHDMIYANQSDLGKSMIRNTAQRIGLTQDEINSCEQSEDILKKIKDDIRIAGKVNVTGTPSVYINGRVMQGGRSLDDFRRIIDRLLNQL